MSRWARVDYDQVRPGDHVRFTEFYDGGTTIVKQGIVERVHWVTNWRGDLVRAAQLRGCPADDIPSPAAQRAVQFTILEVEA